MTITEIGEKTVYRCGDAALHSDVTQRQHEATISAIVKSHGTAPMSGSRSGTERIKFLTSTVVMLLLLLLMWRLE